MLGLSLLAASGMLAGCRVSPGGAGTDPSASAKPSVSAPAPSDSVKPSASSPADDSTQSPAPSESAKPSSNPTGEPSASAPADMPGMPADSSTPSAPAESNQGLPNGLPSVPAFDIPGLALKQAAVSPLGTAPTDLNQVHGTAWLAQGSFSGISGTVVTLQLSGLKPNTAYVAHLHAQPCSTDNGGKHWQFDASQPASAPNEVHLAIKTDATGAAIATTYNQHEVKDGAKSVVVHAADNTRLACGSF